MEDKTAIKYLYEHATSTILFFVSFGFVLSLSYNLSYFYHIDKFSYLTILNFNDYVESSLKFIVLILIALFYAQVVHVNRNGILGKFREAKECQKEVENSTQSIYGVRLRRAAFILLSLLGGAILFIQMIGVSSPYLIAGYYTFMAYLQVLSIPNFHEAAFLNTAITVPLWLIVFDFLIARSSEGYELRKLIFKGVFIVVSMSIALGAYDAAKDINSSVHQEGDRFLRAVSKGVFLLDDKDEFVFKPWDKVDLVRS